MGGVASRPRCRTVDADQGWLTLHDWRVVGNRDSIAVSDRIHIVHPQIARPLADRLIDLDRGWPDVHLARGWEGFDMEGEMHRRSSRIRRAIEVNRRHDERVRTVH